jgi:hypothetical protein
MIFLAVGVLYGLLRMSLVRYQLRRGYSRNPALREPVSFSFAADRLRGHGAADRHEVRWTSCAARYGCARTGCCSTPPKQAVSTWICGNCRPLPRQTT